MLWCTAQEIRKLYMIRILYVITTVSVFHLDGYFCNDCFFVILVPEDDVLWDVPSPQYFFTLLCIPLYHHHILVYSALYLLFALSVSLAFCTPFILFPHNWYILLSVPANALPCFFSSFTIYPLFAVCLSHSLSLFFLCFSFISYSATCSLILPPLLLLPFCYCAAITEGVEGDTLITCVFKCLSLIGHMATFHL